MGAPVRSARHHWWALGCPPDATLAAHAAAGIRVDCSLGFNDRIGFRRGIAYPFRPFDRNRRQPIPVWELPTAAMDKIEQILTAKSLADLRPIFSKSETGQRGLDELEEVFSFLKMVELQNEVVFDITLARGLSYYTGCIFEVSAKNFAMGSIGGGGRYADLTGVFGMPGLSGVGVSFGADRIYDVLEGLKLFPENLGESIRALFVTFDAATFQFAFSVLTKLRAVGVASEIYPSPEKMKKQMEYANRRAVPFVVIVGETEMNSGQLAVKNMKTGEQTAVSVDGLAGFLSK